jgi:cyclopropane-fatty-acyl-phospholipid synthase
VLEIGTGWGGFAIHAARHYGCRVTTTTISQQQFTFAQQRLREMGLADQVTVLLQDYRDLSGSYDRLVSIEMIEAVGHRFLDAYFAQCCKLLKPDGMMALQAIIIPDNRYDDYRRNVDFIQKYIFPGGCLPSFSAMTRALQRGTDFRLIHSEDFAAHYGETIAHWRQNFWSHEEQVRQMGFDERFLRMWNYYLCYCEAGFRERQIGVSQLVLARPESRRSLVGPDTTC